MQRGKGGKHGAVKTRRSTIADSVNKNVSGRSIGGIHHGRRVLQTVREQEDVAQIPHGCQLAISGVEAAADSG